MFFILVFLGGLVLVYVVAGRFICFLCCSIVRRFCFWRRSSGGVVRICLRISRSFVFGFWKDGIAGRVYGVRGSFGEVFIMGFLMTRVGV